MQSKWDPEQKFTFVARARRSDALVTTRDPASPASFIARKVSRITTHLRTLAHAYALTEDARYARAARAILLRMAEVLPRFTWCAPATPTANMLTATPAMAAERISNLPTDELVVPPNKPDRKLHTAYWSASRIGSSGLDGRGLHRHGGHTT